MTLDEIGFVRFREAVCWAVESCLDLLQMVLTLLIVFLHFRMHSTRNAII